MNVYLTTATVKRIHRSFNGLGLIPQFLLLMVVCLPLAWGVIGVGLIHLRHVAENESNRDVSNVSRVYAEEVDATVGMIDLSLIGLRAHWLRNRQEFPAILENFNGLVKDKLFLQIAFTDARGIMVFSSADPGAGALDLSDREHVRIHLNERRDKLFVSKPVLGRVSRKWSVQFTRPVYTADGVFDGVIVASVAPAYLSRLYEQIDLGAGASIVLARADGAVLAQTRRPTENLKLESMLTGPAFGAPQGATSGSYLGVSQIDGVARFFAWRHLERNGLVVIVGQSVDDAYAAYSGQRNMYLGVGMAGSILLVLLGYSALHAASMRRRIAKALASAEALWKFALEGAGDGVWDWDFDSRTVTLSSRAVAILQADSEIQACTAVALQAIIHPEDWKRVHQALQAYFDGKTPAYVVEHRVRARDGWTWILLRGMVVERTENGTPMRMVGTFSDISDRKAKDEIIAHQSQHDSLTGLPNRLLLSDRLNQALTRARRESTKLALVYFDLDKFKPVNDTYGHEVGDNLLKAVAGRLRERLRGVDSIARVGGDEFVLLLPDVREEADAVIVASIILDLLNTPFEVDGFLLQISSSIGIATYPTDGEDEASLLRCADRAMYQAKAGGRNQIRIYQEN